MNQMWACLGAKHLPSVVYRLRMVVLQDQERSEEHTSELQSL